jgi:hypothetical protein
MSELEKKGSPWPWFLVPIAAVSLFFVLRECRRTLPAAEQAPAHEAAAPAAEPAPAEPKTGEAETAPDSTPAPPQ